MVQPLNPPPPLPPPLSPDWKPPPEWAEDTVLWLTDTEGRIRFAALLICGLVGLIGAVILWNTT